MPECGKACKRNRERIREHYDVPASGPDGWYHSPGSCDSEPGSPFCSHWKTRHFGGAVECFSCGVERESDA